MTTAAAKAGGVNTWISSFERAAVAQARPGAMGKGAIIGAAVTFAVCGTVIGTMKFRQARSSHLQDLKQKSVEAKEQINSHLADDDDDQPISSASAG